MDAKPTHGAAGGAGGEAPKHHEIERKWLVHGADVTWLEPHFRSERVVNVYVAVEGKTQLRVRRRDKPTGTAYTLTVKGKPSIAAAPGLARAEIEFPITEEQFGALAAVSARPRTIVKDRRVIPLGDGLLVELDDFDGMSMAEVEFPSPAAAAEFCPPVWFGPEVTDDPAFGNCELALRLGSPEFASHCERVWEEFTPYVIAERAREVLRRRLPLEPGGKVKYLSRRTPRGGLEHYRDGGSVAFVGGEVITLQTRLDLHRHPGVRESVTVVAGSAAVLTAGTNPSPSDPVVKLVAPTDRYITTEADQWHALHVRDYVAPWDPYLYGAYVLRGVITAKATVYAPGTPPYATTLFELD